MELTEAIRQQTIHIQEKIRRACIRCGRRPDEVQLLLATKTVPPENIRAAIAAGARLIGENKVQELRDKDAALQGLDIERHFIGHLQSNKVKDVLKYAGCIQSVDRISIAEQLDRRLQAEGRGLDIYVQVNTSAEDSKFGIAPAEAVDFIKALRPFRSLRLKGLMTIGLLDADPEWRRPSLRQLRLVRNKIMREGIEGIGELGLSMGMSGDMEMAIEEGATLVRIGTAIFGNRIPGKEVWDETAAANSH
ncbi:YggS family pyridoxal phosphate-dependent enzyme [Chitinophaga lutea]|uniref:Pyridoxal phosphate homeostasis protein n=1 Tax=Chitinophaga lutea TaxID=2488634 RepID=A0A3N4QAA8_9BACT|nr:YggS family pyridoxal phosphate-dependent enzyme [Chitinophaga lutea]RPE08674.1 YggS family pyridoxal phosphate-dependent enzyme [Chitinophaga lutea]